MGVKENSERVDSGCEGDGKTVVVKRSSRKAFGENGEGDCGGSGSGFEGDGKTVVKSEGDVKTSVVVKRSSRKAARINSLPEFPPEYQQSTS